MCYKAFRSIHSCVSSREAAAPRRRRPSPLFRDEKQPSAVSSRGQRHTRKAGNTVPVGSTGADSLPVPCLFGCPVFACKTRRHFCAINSKHADRAVRGSVLGRGIRAGCARAAFGVQNHLWRQAQGRRGVPVSIGSPFILFPNYNAAMIASILTVAAKSNHRQEWNDVKVLNKDHDEKTKQGKR